MTDENRQKQWEMRGRWILAACVMALILYLSYETRDETLLRTDGLLQLLLPWLQRVLGPFTDQEITLSLLRGPIRKLAHVANFFLLGVAVSAAFLGGGHGTRRDLWKAFVIVVAFAGLDELLQLFRPMRGGPGPRRPHRQRGGRPGLDPGMVLVGPDAGRRADNTPGASQCRQKKGAPMNGPDFFRVQSLGAFDDHAQVSGISFRLGRGECLLLAVPSRAERCLLAHALVGTRPASSGEVWVGRRRFTDEMASARLAAGMGLVIPRDCYYASLCDERDLCGCSFGYCRTPVFPAKARWLGGKELCARLRKECIAVPGGDRSPRVLVFAEPVLGDPADHQALRQVLTRYRQQGGVLVVLTNRPGDYRELADHAGLLREGRLWGLARAEAGLLDILRNHGEME